MGRRASSLPCREAGVDRAMLACELTPAKSSLFQEEILLQWKEHER